MNTWTEEDALEREREMKEKDSRQEGERRRGGGRGGRGRGREGERYDLPTLKYTFVTDFAALRDDGKLIMYCPHCKRVDDGREE